MVGVFAIGSELVTLDQVPTPGKIRDCNTWCLSVPWPATPGPTCASLASFPTIKTAINGCARRARWPTCDLVVSAGGASQGDFDFIKDVVAESGSSSSSRTSRCAPASVRPWAIVDGKPVFGLSGNPAACLGGL